MEVNQIDRAELTMVLRPLYDLYIAASDHLECSGQGQIKIEGDNATDGTLDEEDRREGMPLVGLRGLEPAWVHAPD